MLIILKLEESLKCNTHLLQELHLLLTQLDLHSSIICRIHIESFCLFFTKETVMFLSVTPSIILLPDSLGCLCPNNLAIKTSI